MLQKCPEIIPRNCRLVKIRTRNLRKWPTHINAHSQNTYPKISLITEYTELRNNNRLKSCGSVGITELTAELSRYVKKKL